MSEKVYQLTETELSKLTQDASISGAIQELAGMLSGRANDLPHRFRAPALLQQYLDDHGVNQSYYHQLQLGYSSNPLMLQVTTRPTQKILELVFNSPDGMRLFTLEIEYAVPEKG